MRVLYVAAGIAAPGSHGGATHVVEVAAGLARLGHEVHVVCQRPKDTPPPQQAERRLDAPQWHWLPYPKSAGLLYYSTVARLARELQPAVIIERFYNFAGVGMLVAHRRHIPAILEVNAPLVDPPGSRKTRLDRLVGQPLRRWAGRQCHYASRIVTPLASTVPSSLEPDRSKICELPWGANVERFDREAVLQQRGAEVADLRQRLGLSEGQPVAVFSGSFRHWHGVDQLATAALDVARRVPEAAFLLLGEGPLLEPVQAIAASLGQRLITPGPVAYSDVPLYLTLASVGVAPFDPSRHEPLRLFGFYWSPLKIFEYMAMSLPTVTIRQSPLDCIIREGEEGLLYPAGDILALADRLSSLLADPSTSARMGASARQRVVAHYSWQEHCRSLERIMGEIGQQSSGGL